MTTRELLAAAVAAEKAMDAADEEKEAATAAAVTAEEKADAATDAAVDAAERLRQAAGEYVRCDGRLYRVGFCRVEEVAVAEAG